MVVGKRCCNPVLWELAMPAIWREAAVKPVNALYLEYRVVRYYERYALDRWQCQLPQGKQSICRRASENAILQAIAQKPKRRASSPFWLTAIV